MRLCRRALAERHRHRDAQIRFVALFAVCYPTVPHYVDHRSWRANGERLDNYEDHRSDSAFDGRGAGGADAGAEVPERQEQGGRQVRLLPAEGGGEVRHSRATRGATTALQKCPTSTPQVAGDRDEGRAAGGACPSAGDQTAIQGFHRHGDATDAGGRDAGGLPGDLHVPGGATGPAAQDRPDDRAGTRRARSSPAPARGRTASSRRGSPAPTWTTATGRSRTRRRASCGRSCRTTAASTTRTRRTPGRTRSRSRWRR